MSRALKKLEVNTSLLQIVLETFKMEVAKLGSMKKSIKMPSRFQNVS